MLLDSDTLADMAAHIGSDAAAELVAYFIIESERLVAKLVTSAAERDDETARRTAHSLKSSSGQFGALALQEIATRLEDAAQYAPERMPALTEQLRDTAGDTFAALEQWLKARN
jgi:HPt (histidine-containing phosphotransfer) domain-containing protein